jgi:hypothetical protein
LKHEIQRGLNAWGRVFSSRAFPFTAASACQPACGGASIDVNKLEIGVPRAISASGSELPLISANRVDAPTLHEIATRVHYDILATF